MAATKPNSIPLETRRRLSREIERLGVSSYASAMRQFQRLGTSAGQRRSLGKRYAQALESIGQKTYVQIQLAENRGGVRFTESSEQGDLFAGEVFFHRKRAVPSEYVIKQFEDKDYRTRAEGLEWATYYWSNPEYAEYISEITGDGAGFVCEVLGFFRPAGEYRVLRQVRNSRQGQYVREDFPDTYKVQVWIAILQT